MFKAHVGLTLASTAIALGSWPDLTIAQVIPDTTLPNNSATTATGSSGTQVITGGTRLGNNLFHSFSDFSVASGNTLRFDHPPSVEIIFSRVTGTNPSSIEGTLETQASADFFLLNPNGIAFGADAQLNIGGSFVASTANWIEFSDGSRFRAISPQPTDLLSINVPIGLQYGGSLGSHPSNIRIDGPGHGLEIDPNTLAVTPVNPPLRRLAVNPGKTLALVGGQVMVRGGNLQSPAGRIALGGVANGGQVGIIVDELGWQLSYDAVPEFADIQLDQAAAAIASGTGGGQIQLVGRSINVLEGSTLIANTVGESAGRGISLNATIGSVISGAVEEADSGFAVFPSSIFSEVDLDQTGDAGNLSIRAPILEVSDGAQISTSTFGAGRGGDISIEADQVRLQGGTPELGPSGLYLDVGNFFATGQGGNLNLRTQQLAITSGANIAANTFGIGDGGTLRLKAEQLDITGGDAELGSSQIIAQVEEGTGQGASILLETEQLNLVDGGQISSSLFLTEGEGGNIDINVDQLNVRGASLSGNSSGIFSQVDLESQGTASDINIQAREVTIAEGAEINSSTFTAGHAGNITLTAEQIVLTGIEADGTGIFSTVGADATGAGGMLTLNAAELVVQNGAQVVVGTQGRGPAGNLHITASKQVLLQGQVLEGRSGLFANALVDAGAGGDIRVETEQLTVQAGATINASNFASRRSLPPGQGAAGGIALLADDVKLLDEASITASTAVGDRGNISINSNNLVLRRRSRITTNAQATATGGNINISSNFIIAPSNENSDITANAVRGEGGNVNVTAQSILGLEFRPQLTSQSDITASSDFGLSGTVVIDQRNGEPEPETAELPEDLADPGDRIIAGCPSQANARFVVSGRGGIPEDPGLGVEEQVLVRTNIVIPRSPMVKEPNPAPDSEAPEWSESIRRHGPSPRPGKSSRIPPNTATRIMSPEPVEARGWKISAQGTVQLLAASDFSSGLSAQRFRPAHNCQPVRDSSAA